MKTPNEFVKHERFYRIYHKLLKHLSWENERRYVFSFIEDGAGDSLDVLHTDHTTLVREYNKQICFQD